MYIHVKKKKRFQERERARHNPTRTRQKITQVSCPTNINNQGYRQIVSDMPLEILDTVAVDL